MEDADRRDAALSVLHRYRQGSAGLAEDALAEIKAILAGEKDPIEQRLTDRLDNVLVTSADGDRFVLSRQSASNLAKTAINVFREHSQR